METSLYKCCLMNSFWEEPRLIKIFLSVSIHVVVNSHQDLEFFCEGTFFHLTSFSFWTVGHSVIFLMNCPLTEVFYFEYMLSGIGFDFDNCSYCLSKSLHTVSAFSYQSFITTDICLKITFSLFLNCIVNDMPVFYWPVEWAYWIYEWLSRN